MLRPSDSLPIALPEISLATPPPKAVRLGRHRRLATLPVPQLRSQSAVAQVRAAIGIYSPARLRTHLSERSLPLLVCRRTRRVATGTRSAMRALPAGQKSAPTPVRGLLTASGTRSHLQGLQFWPRIVHNSRLSEQAGPQRQLSPPCARHSTRPAIRSICRDRHSSRRSLHSRQVRWSLRTTLFRISQTATSPVRG